MLIMLCRLVKPVEGCLITAATCISTPLLITLSSISNKAMYDLAVQLTPQMQLFA